MLPGEKYEINADLGDYSGTTYYIEYSFVGESNFVTLDGSTLVVDDFVPSTQIETLKLALKKEGSSSNYDIRFIYVTAEESDIDYEITFDDPDYFLVENERHYLMLRPGESYTLKPILKGINALVDFTYQTYDDEPVMEIEDSGKVTMGEDVTIGERSAIHISAYYRDCYLYTDFIYVEACEDHWYINLTLESADERVEVERMSYSTYDYRVTIPYAGVYYALPAVEVSGCKDENATLRYEQVAGEEDIEFDIDESKSNFRLKATSSGYVCFAISLYGSDNALLKQAIAKVYLSRLGRGEFKFYLGEEQTEVKDGETLTLQKDLSFVYSLYYNGRKINGAAATHETSDESCVKLNSSAMSIKVQKVGEAVITFSLIAYDGTKTAYEYSISINIVVVDNSVISKIYGSSGAGTFYYDNGKLITAGKIYVEYDTGYTKVVNGDENLKTLIEDTEDENVKKLTLTYEENGYTVSVTYLIGTSSTKKDITHTYEDVNQASFYGNVSLNGDLKVIALPIWFSDSSSFISETLKDEQGKTQKEQVLEDIHTGIFGENDETGWRSVKTFYEEESFSAINISGDVASWYEVSKASTEFDRDDYDTWIEVADDALNAHFETTNTSIEDYDGNDDGIVDAIMLYYGANYVGADKNSRAYCLKYSRPHAYSHMRNYTWNSALANYGLTTLDSQTEQLSTPDLSDLSLKYGDYKLNNVTDIHEFGHVLGVKDYYDESRSDANNYNSPAGYFSMQDNNRSGHEPFSVMGYGWADPYVYDASAISSGTTFDVTINDFQSSHDFIMLTPSFNEENQMFDEYLLLELFSPTGLNEFYANKYSFSTYGIRLWHVNAIMTSLNGAHYYSNNSGSGSEYNLLQWIRDDKTSVFRKDGSSLTSNGALLFEEGESFDMDAYKSQFANADGLLDDGRDLGFSFSVDKLDIRSNGQASATIKITRN